MDRNVFALGLGLVLALGMVGCASVDTGSKFNDAKIATSGQAVAHVNGESWGIYFLPIFPILTGDTSTPGSIAVLQDTVRVEPVVDMTTKKARELGATSVLDLQSNRQSLFIFPPLLLWYKSCQVSGNAMK